MHWFNSTNGFINIIFLTMGFFSNTKAAIDLIHAADAINDCFKNRLLPYLNKYNLGQTYNSQDYPYIRAGVEFIEKKVIYMRLRLQDLPADKWMYTMVRAVDGHSTPVLGYIMAMLDLCKELRKGF